ncbi:MAG: hypothetical protein L6R36_000230 [Xanthoria steineri]|nr:MAG: hypothetical protein L6R36_000230 [Xanthoria steineri]
MLKAGYPSGQPPPQNQKPQLVGLAPEVLLHILDHLHRKKWLRAFLLVCKPFYDLALAKLYHRIEWTMPDHDSELLDNPDGNFELLQMLERDNAGLKHIRELVLFDEIEHTRSYRDIHQYPDAVLFAYFLPRNTLTTFHQTIEWLFGYGSFSTVRGLQNIDRLRLMPDEDEQVPAVACKLLQQHQEIRHLELDLFCMSADEGKEKAPFRSMDAMQALFAGFKLAPLSLVTLHLDRVNLENSQQDLGPALRLEALKELRIIQCKHADMFLTVLSQSTSLQEHPMHLERLVIYHDQSGDVVRDSAMTRDPDRIITALDVFLMSNTGTLHELWICLRGFQILPNATGVAKHGSTLKWLFLDVRRTKVARAITYSLADWEILCQSLKVLQQLDSAYPSVVADGKFYEHRDFVEHIWETWKMSRLQILGISDYPFQLGTGPQHPDANRDRLVDPTYPPMMSELAKMIFRSQSQYHMSKHMRKELKIITFGINEGVKRGGPSCSSMLFAKSQVKVLDGEQKVSMEEVEYESSNNHTIRRVRREYDIHAFAEGYLE